MICVMSITIFFKKISNNIEQYFAWNVLQLQIKEQSNRTLNPNMTVEEVNELATQLEVVVNGNNTDTKTVTEILSHMSEIEITNSQTVEVK